MASRNPFLREAVLIGGTWDAADNQATIAVTNPANGEIIGTVPNVGAHETRRAIAAAEAAFTVYSKTTAIERSELLRSLHDRLLAHREELAELLTMEQGKPISEARAEIAQSASYVLWFAEETRRTYGDTIPSPWPDRRLFVNKQPVGVVAAITPWNFPSSMLARKIAPALAAGCTVVVKPATQTPYSALAWGILCEAAGFPNGAVNIVTGSPGPIGDELCSNPAVRKLTFTGSTAVGKILMEKCASTVKKVSMELGGNAPLIVFDDADIDRAVDGAMRAKFRNSGQTCVCANRIFVQAGIYDVFVDKFSAAARDLRVGNGFSEGIEQGPLIDERAAERIEQLLSQAVQNGARVLTGGKRHDLGYSFFEPTVVTDVTEDMMLMQEETFGPVAPISRFETEQDVIDAANSTEYGLAAYFYTKDLSRAVRVSEKLEFGMVGINESLITTVEAPFGGIKASGLGREGGYQGIADYQELKYVCLAGIGIQ